MQSTLCNVVFVLCLCEAQPAVRTCCSSVNMIVFTVWRTVISSKSVTKRHQILGVTQQNVAVYINRPSDITCYDNVDSG